METIKDIDLPTPIFLFGYTACHTSTRSAGRFRFCVRSRYIKWKKQWKEQLGLQRKNVINIWLTLLVADCTGTQAAKSILLYACSKITPLYYLVRNVDCWCIALCWNIIALDRENAHILLLLSDFNRPSLPFKQEVKCRRNSYFTDEFMHVAALRVFHYEKRFVTI